MDAAEIFAPRCPVCGRERVTPAGRAGMAFRRACRCGACGARFVEAGSGRYRLVRCDPRAVARSRRLVIPSACAACIPCLVGRALTRAEWARAAAAIHEGPPVPSEPAPGPGVEVTLGLSEPVYRDLGEPSHRERGGTLIVTNRRLVYSHDDRVWEAALTDVVEVEPTPPGFRVGVRGVPQPLHFFPPAGDPIADVIRQAARTP